VSCTCRRHPSSRTSSRRVCLLQCFWSFGPVSTFAVARISTAGDIKVYFVGYIFCIIGYHICQDIFSMIDIMYCRLSYVSRGVLPLKTPILLYIYTVIKQYNHLIFDSTPLSNKISVQYGLYCLSSFLWQESLRFVLFLCRPHLYCDHLFQLLACFRCSERER
jgi:hypothetical protein